MTNKTTHTIDDVDALILEKTILLKTAETKEEKLKLRKQIDKLIKHYNDCNEKRINGKKYPNRLKPLYDTTPYTEKQKKEALKLIDDIDTIDPEGFNKVTSRMNSYVDLGVDVSGVFISKE